MVLATSDFVAVPPRDLNATRRGARGEVERRAHTDRPKKFNALPMAPPRRPPLPFACRLCPFAWAASAPLRRPPLPFARAALSFVY